jgi:WD40 repeat protein
MADKKKVDEKKPAAKTPEPAKKPAAKDGDSAKKRTPTKSQADAAAKGDAKSPDAVDPTLVHMAVAWKYSRPLTACRYSPDGKYVFVGTEDYTVQRIRLSDGRLTPLVGHESWVRAIGFTPDSRTTLTAGYDGRILWWDTAAEKPTPLRTVQASDGWIRALAVSPDGRYVATAANDGHVRLHNISDGRLRATGRRHDSHVYHVAFHPAGGELASCDLKAQCKVWDVSKLAKENDAYAADLKLVREFPFAPIYKYDTQFRADIGGARSMAFGDGGKLLTAGGISNVTNAFAGIGNATWVAVNFADGKQATVHISKEKVNGTGWGIAWHPQGYWVAAGGGNQGGFLYFFKPGTDAEFFKFKLPDTARDLTLSPDGKSVAVAHFDGNLRVYRLGPKI